ncbi:hypothetical protein ARMSODRAFT_148 [Armillaria solidipes]|uniref:Uncharacterized protein n=1 Tax=Armillaria solidipes TaxID=1076256 RepID=A0A2H3CGT8_9AGAR|nr:hypothetical protein ARMSODRAFT_148 [Armillaria solidipes]
MSVGTAQSVECSATPSPKSSLVLQPVLGAIGRHWAGLLTHIGLGSWRILTASSTPSQSRHVIFDPDVYEIGCEHLNVQSDEPEYNRFTSVKLVAIVTSRTKPSRYFRVAFLVGLVGCNV